MTTAEEIYQETNPRIYTAAENQAWEEAKTALKAAGYDFWTKVGTNKNTSLIHNYFNDLKNRAVPVTFASVVNFVNAESKRGVFSTVTPAAKSFYEIAQDNFGAAQAVSDWLKTQGGVNQLQNTGEELFTNAAALLRQLNGRSDINASTCATAASQLSNKPGNKLVWVPIPKQANPYQHKEEDVKGNDRVNWTAADYKREAQARADAEAKGKQITPEAAVEKADEFYRFMVTENFLRFGSHSENFQLNEMFKKLKDKKASWKEIYAELEAEVNHLKRKHLVGRSSVVPTFKGQA